MSKDDGFEKDFREILEIGGIKNYKDIKSDEHLKGVCAVVYSTGRLKGFKEAKDD